MSLYVFELYNDSKQRYQILPYSSLMVSNAPHQYQPQTTNFHPAPLLRGKKVTIRFPEEMVMFPFKVTYQTRDCLIGISKH